MDSQANLKQDSVNKLILIKNQLKLNVSECMYNKNLRIHERIKKAKRGKTCAYQRGKNVVTEEILIKAEMS